MVQKIMIALLTFALICMFLLLINLDVAKAHSWYDWECCNERDCTPVTKVEQFPNYVIYHSDMYSPIKVTHEELRTKIRDSIPFEIKNSQDSSIHLCGYEYVRDDKPGFALRCIYFPGSV